MSDTRILILGANGMLGHDLAAAFSDLHPTLWDVAECDITDVSATARKIRELSPALIINAAAYTNVDGAEADEARATLINGTAVGDLARIANSVGAILAHYSTDYVFSGQKKQGYREDEPIEPLNAYGRSKAAGERLLQEQTKNFYLIRTAWLYGKHGKNFVDTMLRLAKERDSISVVNDQHGKPTWTRDLAKRTRFLFDYRADYPYGIYHLTNEGETTWFEFAKAIFENAQIQVEVRPVTSADYSTPATRPAYSSLVNTKLPPMRSWQEALTEYFSIESPAS